MATFAYKVRDRSGKIFTGNMEGENRSSVVSRLREMDYFITSVNEKKGNILFSKQINLFQSIKLRDLTLFYLSLLDSHSPIRSRTGFVGMTEIILS